MEQLGKLLPELRSSDFSTAARLAAIPQFVQLLIEDPVEAAQIENSLFQHTFCWPLLVFEGTTSDVAVSVPLVVDARFDADRDWRMAAQGIGNNAYLKGAERLDLQTPDARGRTFASYLSEAVKVARELWLSSHGHTGDWRREVERAPIVFDFHHAAEVVKGLLSKLALYDGSAGAYLAQAVLARLLGRTTCLSSAMTGGIGPRVLHLDGSLALDYTVETPADVPKKLRWVFESHMFERVIIPNDKELEASLGVMLAPQDNEPTTRADNQTAEVVHAASLSTAADICQVLGWRKTQYIRCPEVAWAIHGPRTGDGTPLGLVPLKDSRFEAVHAALAQGKGAVVTLSGIAPAAVASYLWHINRLLLPDLNPRPPSLSWAFIRTEDFEQDASFWHVLWRIIGAPEEAFEQFRCSPTRDSALGLLARILNTFEPSSQAKSHRAPDVVVIIGPERFDRVGEGIHTPAQRPLAVSGLLQELEKPGRLVVCDARRPSSGFSVFQEWLGKTRIILLSEPTVPESKQRMHITPNDLAILDRLCIFRWSFSQHSAALVLRDLELRGTQVRENLDRLVDLELLHYFGGEYFLPAHVKRDVESRTIERDHAKLADRHFAAGAALAPYWSASDYPAVAYDTAFIPERVHEAQEHFTEAGRLFANRGDKEGKEMAREALSRVMRFGRIAGWGVARGLIQSRDGAACKDAYLFIEDYMEGWRNHPLNAGKVPNHPLHIADAAKALRYFTPPKEIYDRYGHVSDHRGAIRELFSCAIKACDGFPNEREYNRLKVLTEYAEYLYHEYSLNQTPELKTDIERINHEVLKMRPSWATCPGVILGSWFDIRGDWCDDEGEAADIYIEGVKFASGYQQLKVKATGALSLARRTHPLLEELEQLPAKNQNEALAILRGAKSGHDRECEGRKKLKGELLRRWDSVIYPRWEAGLKFLRRVWADHSACTQRLAEFGKKKWVKSETGRPADRRRHS
ncbi:MAG: hypothetical protein ACLQNE_05845 [Thermoguttaceae bacterium]